MNQTQRDSTFHELLLLVMGFLGGIAFTTLVLIFQDKALIENVWMTFNWPPIYGQYYFNLLTGMLGGAGAISILGSVIALMVGSGVVPQGSGFDQMGRVCFFLVAAALMVIIPFAFVPFSWETGAAIAAFEIIMVVSSGFVSWNASD